MFAKNADFEQLRVQLIVEYRENNTSVTAQEALHMYFSERTWTQVHAHDCCKTNDNRSNEL